MDDPVRRVAVTGAAGYVATKLIRRLEGVESIERVLAIDLRPPGRPYGPKVAFERRDVTTPMADLLSDHDIQAVIHLAFVLRPVHDRKAVRRVNVGGMASVLEACDGAGVGRFVYLSSTTVYGAHPDNPPLLTEESPIRPVEGFQYGEDKAEAEALLARFAQAHPTLSVAVLRTCPILGPTADNFIARALSKPSLIGVRGYDPPMQFLHEDDLAEALVACLLGSASGVYNLAGEGTITLGEMTEVSGQRLVRLPAPLAYRLVGTTWRLRLQRESPACGLDFVRYPWTVAADKIARELGVRPRRSSREAWEEFVARRRHYPSAEPSESS